MEITKNIITNICNKNQVAGGAWSLFKDFERCRVDSTVAVKGLAHPLSARLPNDPVLWRFRRKHVPILLIATVSVRSSLRQRPEHQSMRTYRLRAKTFTNTSPCSYHQPMIFRVITSGLMIMSSNFSLQASKIKEQRMLCNRNCKAS
jgi:hypothetical protein